MGFDANGDGDTTRDRPGLLGRNTFTAPRQLNFDANLSKTLKINERHQLEGRFEVFNLFNNVSVASVNNVIGLNAASPPASFGRPTSVAPNRQIQLSARYSF